MYSNAKIPLTPDKDFQANFKGYNFNPENNLNQPIDLEKITLTMENRSLKAEVTKLQSLAYSLQNENYVLKSIQQVDYGKALGEGVRMQRKQILVHLISNAVSWVVTGVFATLFFSGAVIAPVIAAAGLVGGLITSIGLTVDSALK